VTRGTRFSACALVAATAVLHGAAQDPPRRDPQTFRTRTDAVVVDVSVRDGSRPVTGLRADSFVLTDNGVRQEIESVEATSVPIDLTLVFDLSGNARSPWADPTPVSKVLANVSAEIRQIAATLRAEDRIRVFAIDRQVQLLAPLASPADMKPLRIVEHGGLASLYDALAAVLLQPVEPARRHVVIARTMGQDNISSVTAASVRAIAQRSDALFHLVMMETAMDNDGALSAFQCDLIGLCWPTRRFWVPAQRRLFGGRPTHTLTRDGETLREAAIATGGDLHKTQLFNEPSIALTFRKAFEEFRNGYVLRYTPRGVPRTGWHAIEVKVPASRGYAIAARKGYGIDEPASAPPPRPAPAAPRTIGELADAYTRGSYQLVVDGIRESGDPRRLLRAFAGAGNPWPSTPKREAAFAVELADAALASEDTDTRREAYDLLSRFVRYVRHPLEADTFERYWHFAVLTLLEGTVRPGAARAFVDAALARFPDEPRFILSRAIVSEQHYAAVGQLSKEEAAGRPGAEDVRRNYEAAVSRPETATEARIRLGGFLQRVGRHEDALAQLTPIDQTKTADPHLRYLRLLFCGNAQAALGRTDEAVAAYRAALDLVPAQSARVALMNALLLRGERAAAEALAQEVQLTDDTLDPWWVYWHGQYRLHGQAMARLRELSR
jgi:VWFA-related protein